jgi:hypothetical protein
MDAISKELQREDEIRAEAEQAVRDAILAGLVHPERIVALWQAALTQPAGQDRITREILRGVLVDMYYRS